ncbi:hypothetical protein B566_EDAN011422 [Ephemera danica]|nr:hypothetical protein B566_EDAN011422 [Ephemera danica]
MEILTAYFQQQSGYRLEVSHRGVWVEENGGRLNLGGRATGDIPGQGGWLRGDDEAVAAEDELAVAGHIERWGGGTARTPYCCCCDVTRASATGAAECADAFKPAFISSTQ